MILDSMIFFARRRRILPPPPLVERAPQPPASPAYDGPGYSFTGRHARSAQTYVPQPDPLTAPDWPVTETAVFGHLLSESPVREFEMKTARASNFRFPVRYLCGREHVNLNADTFADLYTSARQAGWKEDRFGTWQDPICAKQFEAAIQAALNAAPVAAIEGGA